MTEFSWTKHGDQWVVRGWDAEQVQPGDQVTVRRRNGEAKQVILGEQLRHDGRVRIFAVAEEEKS